MRPSIARARGHRAAPLLATLAILVAPSIASGQSANDPDALRPGAPVRITAPGSPRFQASVVARSAESLRVVLANGDSADVALADVRRLEAISGKRRHTWKGVGLGFLGGAAVGAAAGLASYRKPACSDDFLCFDFGPEFAAAAGAVVGALPGAIIGGIIGHAKQSDRWREVATDRVRVSLAPAPRRRVALAASVAF